MKEFMFYIRNGKNAKENMTKEQNLEFVRKCEVYIKDLRRENKLIAAQPLIREGIVIKKDKDSWKEMDIISDNELQVGYYHIMASDIDEAVKIAKLNPEFEYVASATIEVRPVKTKEIETGFTYPSVK